MHAWILLDDDPAQLARTIAAAPRFGVNEIQLSHELVYDVDDLLAPGSEGRVQLLTEAITLAHAEGLRAFAWTHELPRSVGASFCYRPSGDDLAERAEAYRRGFERLPGLDGVVLMFGSARRPPWRTMCWCPWCLMQRPCGYPFRSPAVDERLRVVVESVGDVVVNELGKQLYVRTFVHEPKENAWHAHALASVRGVPFLGMHKSEVQDWQPYNPPDPTMGDPEAHDSILELDAAGEFWGGSVLPFAAPEYFWFRLQSLRERRGVGVAVRTERGGVSALGTPNEVNLLAVSRLVRDPRTPLESIWAEFLERSYGLAPGTPAQATLERILKDTFPIRLESHYVLGIWAMEKSSEFPRSPRLRRLFSEGRMPQWDPAWSEIWERVARPDRETVLWIWQEAGEAVDRAQHSLAQLEGIEAQLAPTQYDDLHRRLVHQLLVAEAWRAIKLYIWSNRALDAEGASAFLTAPARQERALLRGWARWAHDEIARVAIALDANGFANAKVASSARLHTFLANTARDVPAVSPEPPEPAAFSPLRTLAVDARGAQLAFSTNRPLHVWLDYGLEAPKLSATLDLGEVAPGVEREVVLTDLLPARRYLAQVRARSGDLELRGGYSWIFTPYGR